MITEADKRNPLFTEPLAEFDSAGGIKSLTADLQALSRNVESDPDDVSGEDYYLDCRLRYHDGAWSFITGDSSYDQDHRGAWGASSVGADLDRDGAMGIAEDLVDQVLESIAAEEVTK